MIERKVSTCSKLSTNSLKTSSSYHNSLPGSKFSGTNARVGCASVKRDAMAGISRNDHDCGVVAFYKEILINILCLIL